MSAAGHESEPAEAGREAVPASAPADDAVHPVQDEAPAEPAPEGSAEPAAAEAGRESAEQAPADSADDVLQRLEEEGEVAADYVEELLDIADLDGDIDIEVRDGRTYVSVVAPEGEEETGLDGLVGRDGRTLEALQELVRLAVLTATGHRTRLILDIGGHRRRRDADLRTQAADAVARVRAGEELVRLPPMGAYERKIVHDVVAEAGLASASEGEGPRRHVVVSDDA